MKILAINKGHRYLDYDNFSDYLYCFGGTPLVCYCHQCRQGHTLYHLPQWNNL